MIKFSNILLESDGNAVSELPLRRVLKIINEKHPELKIKLKNYLRRSKDMDFTGNYVYSTISNFLSTNLDITDSYTIKQITLSYLINPNVVDFTKDKIFLPTDMYLTIVEYTEEDYEVTDATNYFSCLECDGAGYEREECQFCSGYGEKEDPDGEEGDTLVCDDCDGLGYVDQDCSYCDGGGEIAEDYEKYELTTITDNYISYVKLPEKIRNIMDGNKYSFSMDYFYEWDDTFILWSRNNSSQESKDGSDDISASPNELLNYPESVKMTDEDVRYFL